MKQQLLRYQLGPAESLAQQQTLAGDALRRAQRKVWKDTLLFVAACAFGLVAAFQANNRLLMLLFGVALLARLTVPWEHKAKFKAGLIALAEKKVRHRDVTLLIDDEGLHEEVEGVRCFAPWHTVKSFRKQEHIFLVELAGGFSLVIPEVAFLGSGAPSAAEFIATLESKGAIMKTAP